MIRLTSIAVCLGLLTASAALGQDDPAPSDKPAKPTFDAVAQKAWDAWKKIQYHASKDGLKRTTFKLKASVESPQLPAPMEATGDYSFDAAAKPVGKLSWSNPQVGAMLARQGWSVDGLNGMFEDDDLKDLAGCKLTGAVKDKKTIITITGHKKNITGFTFNEKGVLEGATISARGQTIQFKMTHKEIDGKYHNTGWSYSVNMQGMTIGSTVKITSTKVGSVYVFQSVTETIQRGGQTMATVKITASDHTVNGPATPTSKPAKGS